MLHKANPRSYLLVLLFLWLVSSCHPGEPDQDSIRLKDTLKKILYREKPDSLQNNYKQPLSSDSFVVQTEKETYEAGFYMITASFHNAEKAREFSAKLRDAGKSPKILKSSEGYYRIAVRKFNRWRMATTYLQEKYQAGDTTIWILHKL